MQAQKALVKGKNGKTAEKLDEIIKKLEREVEKNQNSRVMLWRQFGGVW